MDLLHKKRESASILFVFALVGRLPVARPVSLSPSSVRREVLWLLLPLQVLRIRGPAQWQNNFLTSDLYASGVCALPLLLAFLLPFWMASPDLVYS